MTLSFREIMAADLTTLEDAAAAWKRMGKRFGELLTDYDSHVRGHLSGGHWAGVAKVTYDEVAKVSAGEFGNAKSQAEGIAKLLTEAYGDLVERKRTLDKRVKEAEDAAMKVDGGGHVELDTEALTEEQKEARRKDPSFAAALNAKVTEWQDAIDKAVESVNDADAAIKAALEASAAPPGSRAAGMHGFNAKQVDYAPPGSREDLDRILREYQVAPDPDGMVDYPRNGALRFLAGGGVTVTSKEADMLDELGISGLQDFQGIRDNAFSSADERFPSKDKNDDHNDAFRHAYWNALMTKKYGADWTEKYTLAHEAIPGNNPEREAMDLHNNEVGRRVAQANPDASEDELADLIQEAVRGGEMVVVPKGGGRLAFSDQLTPDETGDPTLPLPEEPRETGSGSTDAGGSATGKGSGVGSGS
ncbi:DUF6973 domain-containing protein [Streptomyces daliensis]|uniref:DUF6973 domain-containing protein n=1 Tax=Streptomyces daliensis TaxID=299421 RepID=A0A8T4IXT9_9ACTN|nr:hypothetical protein [Streptomyces daliensis]